MRCNEMIEKILNIKKLSYSSNLNAVSLKKKIEDIFDQETSTLVGKFTNKNEFTVYDKWTIITWYVPNFKRKSAYLNGEIIELEKGVLIKVTIKSNSILSIFAILSLIIGVVSTITAKLNVENNQLLFVGLVFIVVGILYYLIGIFLRNRLQKNFEQYVDLMG
jgi:hypothetical protein